MNTVKKYEDVQKMLRDVRQLPAAHVYLHSNIWIDIEECLCPVENLENLFFLFVTTE